MKIEFELVKDDYKKAFFELLIKVFYRPIFFICLSSIFISLLIAGTPPDWKIFFISFPVSVVFLVFILFGKSIFRNYKNCKIIENNPLYFGKKTIFLVEDGIIIGTEKPIKYNWNSIKKLEKLPNYLIIFFQNSTLTINKIGVPIEDINKLIVAIKSNILNKK